MEGVGGERQLNELLAQTLALPLHKKGRLASLSCLVKSWDLHKETFLHPSLFNPSIRNIVSAKYRNVFWANIKDYRNHQNRVFFHLHLSHSELACYTLSHMHCYLHKIHAAPNSLSHIALNFISWRAKPINSVVVGFLSGIFSPDRDDF